MFIVDDLLFLPARAPLAGVMWIAKQVQTAVEQEMLDDSVWKQRLVELQMRLEVGEISQEDFTAEQAVALERLRQIRAFRREIARRLEEAAGGGDEPEGISVHDRYGE